MAGTSAAFKKMEVVGPAGRIMIDTRALHQYRSLGYRPTGTAVQEEPSTPDIPNEEEATNEDE